MPEGSHPGHTSPAALGTPWQFSARLWRAAQGVFSNTHTQNWNMRGKWQKLLELRGKMNLCFSDIPVEHGIHERQVDYYKLQFQNSAVKCIFFSFAVHYGFSAMDFTFIHATNILFLVPALCQPCFKQWGVNHVSRNNACLLKCKHHG